MVFMFLCVSIPNPDRDGLRVMFKTKKFKTKCTLSLDLSRPSLHNHIFGAQNCSRDTPTAKSTKVAALRANK